MDLISREAVNNLEKSDAKGSDYDRGWNDALYAVDMLPSAFEGMTNGEVIQALFPNCVKCCDGRDVKETDNEVLRARRLRSE